MSDRDRPLDFVEHFNDLYREINSQSDDESLKRLERELSSAISMIKTRLNRERSKELSDYSTTDLASTTHWTSKDDLKKALGNSPLASDQTIDSLWSALTSADKGLQQFYPGQLSAIIEYKKKHK